MFSLMSPNRPLDLIHTGASFICYQWQNKIFMLLLYTLGAMQCIARSWDKI